MRFGYFDKKNREFVVKRPDTPLPWINYLGCEKYCALMSNTAGGYSFWADPLENRILRYRYNNIPSDRGGRYIYIKDRKSQDFWSASWQPVLKDIRKYKYECRHGLGYTKISSEYEGIKTETVYFVPLGENLELWMLNIKNKSARKRDLNVFSFVEFCLPNALEDMTNFQANLNVGETDYENGVIYHVSKHRVKKGHFSFFGLSNRKVDSFDTRRDDFLGPYGDLSAPRAVLRGRGSNKLSCGWAPVGSHCINISLKPGEEKPIIFALGIAFSKKEAREHLNKYNNRNAVESEIAKLKQRWSENLGKFKVKTPDKDMNLMVNTWNQYQCRTTFNWSRSASYYESGIGRGMGFRDTNQDVLGFVYQVPKEAKETIYDIASTQFEEGDAHHQYSPLTKKGRERGYSDDHLWLIFSVAAYIKETGDIGFLDEEVPFNNGKTAPLIEHLEKAVCYASGNTGPHGFPLAGYADWNDCLNLIGPNKKAESVLVAQMLVAASSELARIFSLRKNKNKERRYLNIAETIKKRVNTSGWDGSWYIRAYDDNQKPVGSKINREGKIFLETQGWALMSGVASGIKARKTLDSVGKMLATEHGIILQQPAYKNYYPELGDVSAYPPGLKENAGIFCHPNPWIVIAECILGRGEKAYEYYKSILPCTKDHSVRRVEPYVYCQMVAGRDHPDFGEGKNSWLTGTAAWNFVAVSQHILGIRPDYDGLEINPCIPKKWDGFSVTRIFRNSVYDIVVRNPEHVNKGVKEISVDGKKLEELKVPAFNDGKKHDVTVVMG
ncbi:MAG: glycosyl transferase [Candidatus Aureabacteria bacterium]|nr:glycosyl transferase [Candidatus Auribacterota bacterium]